MKEFISGYTYEELFLMPYWRLSEIYKASSRKDKKALKDSGLYDWRRFILCWFAVSTDSTINLMTDFVFVLSYSKWINESGVELSDSQLRYRFNKLIEEGLVASSRCGTGFAGVADGGVSNCNVYALRCEVAESIFTSNEERTLAIDLVSKFRIFERP